MAWENSLRTSAEIHALRDRLAQASMDGDVRATVFLRIGVSQDFDGLVQVTKELAESRGGGRIVVVKSHKMAEAFTVRGDVGSVLKFYSDVNVVDVVPSQIDGVAIRPAKAAGD